MKTIRKHDRAEGQVQTSIATDEALLSNVKQIAIRERRSRNKQIALFLERQIAEYERINGQIRIPMASEPSATYKSGEPK